MTIAEIQGILHDRLTLNNEIYEKNYVETIFQTIRTELSNTNEDLIFSALSDILSQKYPELIETQHLKLVIVVLLDYQVVRKEADGSLTWLVNTELVNQLEDAGLELE